MKRYFTALYPYNATDFWSQGYGVISDALSSVTTEAANSNGTISYQLEMTYPKNGPLASKLVEGNLIRCAESSDLNKFMIFEIVESNKADTGNLTIYGEAYPNRVRRMTFKNGGKFKTFNSPQAAINAGIGQIDGWPADFVVTCEVSGKLDFRDEQGNPTIFEDFGAFLDAINEAIHGEVEYTAWNRVRIYSKRGRDRKDEIQLRDDKNISGVTVKTDHSSIINVIVPLIPIKDAEGNPTAETKVGKVVKSAKPFEFINYYAGKVVQTDTQELANSYFNRTHADRPSVTVDVDPEVNEEDLTSLQLFDTVTLYSKSLGYSTSIRVAQRDFDNLTGRVSHFSLGSSGSSIFTSSSSEIEQLKQQVTAAENAGQVALVTADGKNQLFPESTDPPQNPREGDIWFKRDGDVVRLMQFHNGDWVKQVSDTTGKEITDKVNEAMNEMTEHVADINKNQIDISKIKTDISKAQGDITQVRQDAKEDLDKLQSTVNKDLDDAKKQAKMAYDESSRVESQAKEALESAVEAKETSVNLQTSVNDLTGELASKADNTTVNTLDRTVKNQATEISQNTKELKAKASSSEVDLLRGTVSENSTQISHNSTALKGKANTTDLNKVSGDLVTLTNNFNVTSKGFEADISQVNSRVADTNKQLSVAKADIKATADNLSTNYTKTTDEHNYVNSQIKQSADQINLSVASVSDKVDTNQTDTDSKIAALQIVDDQIKSTVTSKVSSSDVQGMLDKGGYATQKWTGSQIKQSADEINSTVTSVSNKVDNLQIGGRNLIHDTSFEQGMWKKIWGYPTMSITSDGNLKFTIPNYSQAGVGVSAETLEMDKTYTLTVKVRGHGEFQPYIMYDGGIGNFDLYDSNSVPYPMINSATDFVDIKYTFTIKGKDPMKQYAFAVLTIDAAGNWLEIKKDSLKLEPGNVSTSWSPAPEDIATVTVLSKVDQKADEISSTLMTVQTQVADSAVGTNLIIQSDLKYGYLNRGSGGIVVSSGNFHSDNYIATNGATVFTFSSPDYVFKGSSNHTLTMYDSDKNYLGYQLITSATQTLSKSNVAYIRFSMNFTDEGGARGNLPDWLANHRYKLEKGSVATDWCTNPADNATVAALSKVDQKADSISTTVTNNKKDADSKFTTVNQTISGIQSTVAGKADASQITQLSNQINLKVSQSDYNTAMGKKADKDNLVSQINIDKSGVLIQGKKIMIDGDATIKNAVIKSSMIDTLDASKITAGTLNAANVNIINMNANNITTGTLRGANLSMNLNTGEVLFQKGSIKSTNGKLNISVNDGTMSVTNSSKEGIYFKDGRMILSNSDPFKNQKIAYGLVSYDVPFVLNGGLTITGYQGALLTATNKNITASSFNDNHPWFRGEVGNIDFYGGFNNGSGVAVRENDVVIGSATGRVDISGGNAFNPGVLWEQPHIEVGSSAWNSGGVFKDNKGVGTNIIMKANGIDLASAGGIAAHAPIFDVYGNFSVHGKKNAVVSTSKGDVAIDAYETAEYYFGDIGSLNTGKSGCAKVIIDSLFNETVNTSIPYHVFITAYEESYIWVTDRTPTSFIVHSSKPNIDVSYEIKAKRLGYEGDRLEIQKGE